MIPCLDVQIRICHIKYALAIFIHSFIHSMESGIFMLYCHFLKEAMSWSKNMYEKQENIFKKMKFYEIALSKGVFLKTRFSLQLARDISMSVVPTYTKLSRFLPLNVLWFVTEGFVDI